MTDETDWQGYHGMAQHVRGWLAVGDPTLHSQQHHSYAASLHGASLIRAGLGHR